MSEVLNTNDLEQVSGGNDGMGNNQVTQYVVKAGDTLSGIGAKLGVNWKKIFEANKTAIIAEANKHNVVCKKVEDYANHIWPGTVLVIPR